MIGRADSRGTVHRGASRSINADGEAAGGRVESCVAAERAERGGDNRRAGDGEDAEAADRRHAGRNAAVEAAAEACDARVFEGQFHAGIL